MVTLQDLLREVLQRDFDLLIESELVASPVSYGPFFLQGRAVAVAEVVVDLDLLVKHPGAHELDIMALLRGVGAAELEDLEEGQLGGVRFRGYDALFERLFHVVDLCDFVPIVGYADSGPFVQFGWVVF